MNSIHNRVLQILALALACGGCGGVKIVDPCSGQTGTCLAIQLKSDVTGLESVNIALTGVVTYNNTVDLAVDHRSLPVAVAILLKDVTGVINVTGLGMQGGVVIAQGSATTNISPGAHVSLDLALAKASIDGGVKDAAPLTDASVVVDASCPSGTMLCGTTCLDTKNDSNNCGACGNKCGTGRTCNVYACDKFVFRSTVLTGYMGNLGGLAGADGICQNEANGRVSGTYKAWLSDNTTDFADSTRSTHSAGRYVLPNGTLVANGWSGLISGTLQSPISTSITDGGTLTMVCCTNIMECVYDLVWTGSNADGTKTGSSCDSWIRSNNNYQGTAGRSNTADAGVNAWSNYCQIDCSTPGASIYCIEQ